MGMPSFSHGVVHRTYPRFPGKDHQPNGAGPWENWGSPRYWPTVPRPKEGVERANGTFQDRLVAELRLAGACTLAEANQVLAKFLPRFNQRFGVPADQAESAYRPVNPELDLGGVLCIKELRRVAKDNTVQYHGRALQLFPSLERPSYAGARVEVQERLDGRLLVRHREQILTPQEAPALATELRARVTAGPVTAILPDPDPTDWRPKQRIRAPVLLGPLAGETIWYEDAARKQVHRDLVVAGMERARQQGKRIGRPSMNERPEFEQRFAAVVQRIGSGELSRNQAARELGIGYATLKRLLQAWEQPNAKPSISLSVKPSSGKDY